MSSPENNNSSNSEDAGSRSAPSSTSTGEERQRLADALKKRRELIERIKEERAKVVGLSRLAALSEAPVGGRQSSSVIVQQSQHHQRTQSTTASFPQTLVLPPIAGGAGGFPAQTAVMLPFSQTKGDWKKAIMEMSTFQSLALQQTLAQQVALRNLVCLQRRQVASAPPVAAATVTTTTTTKEETKQRDKPAGMTAQQMIELLKGTKNMEIRQEPSGFYQIGMKGSRNCHNHHCHCCHQQQQPQLEPVPQYLPPPRPVMQEDEQPTPRRRRSRRRSPSPEEDDEPRRRPAQIIRERSVTQPGGPIRVEVNVPNQPSPRVIQQQPGQQQPIYVPYPVQQQQQQPQPQQPIYLPQQQPQQSVVYQQRQRHRRRREESESESESESSESESEKSEEEQTRSERRVTFRLNNEKRQEKSTERCETPPPRKHRIRAKIANLMWPGIGISWWMRNEVVRSLRRTFYVAWMFGCIRRALEMRGVFHEPQPLDGVPDYLTFEICLKDIAAAVVGVYLNMHGPIRSLIDSLLGADAIDLRAAFTRGSEAALKEIKYLIENVCYHITDIQPDGGALGTHKKALLQHLISEGQLFPGHELWQFERDRIGFDYSGRTMGIGDREAMLLITRAFFRPLINLMINPVGFGWAQTAPSPPQAASLRIMASIFTYIYRRAVTPRTANNISIPAVPEIGRYLIPDQTLTPVLRELQAPLDYVDNLLREWSLSYVHRLRMTALGLSVPPNYMTKEFGGTEPFVLAPDLPALPPPG